MGCLTFVLYENFVAYSYVCSTSLKDNGLIMYYLTCIVRDDEIDIKYQSAYLLIILYIEYPSLSFCIHDLRCSRS